MKTAKRQTGRFLGEVETVITGGSYCDAAPEAGETVRFVREPENTHDRNALRVENGNGEKLGYIPRRIAKWMAPLMDREWIDAEGRIVAERPAYHERCPLRLSIHLRKAGEVLLKRDLDPKTPQMAFHQAVVTMFHQAARWGTPHVATRLGAFLQSSGGGDILPETWLLLALFPFVEQNSKTERAAWSLTQAKTTLKNVRLGAPVHYDAVTLFPLFAPNGHERSYVLLEEAIESGCAEVREVSEHGSVPDLMLLNNGARPLLIPEGEILVGAKQNRVVNITVIVAAHSTFILPVSCVEQGRWSHVSQNFNVSRYAPPSLRARKNASVRENMARTGSATSNQGEVWADVQCCLRESGVDSCTDSLADVYEATESRINTYRENLVLPQEASGVMVVSDHRVVGVELFDSPVSFGRVWPRISEAYYLEMSNRKGRRKTEQPVCVDKFWESLPEKLNPVAEQIGLGARFDLTGENLAGSGVWFEGLYQMSALVLDEGGNRHRSY